MAKRRLILILLTAIIVFGVGLSASKNKHPSGSSPVKTIEVRAGERFIIRLDSNRTTGYQWELVRPLDADILELVSSEYRPAESKLVGAGGKEVWTFKAVGPGKARVSFKFLRPWEKNVKAVESVDFIIMVGGLT